MHENLWRDFNTPRRNDRMCVPTGTALVPHQGLQSTARFSQAAVSRESKQLQEMLQGLAEVTSTLLQESPICCVSSMWSSSLSLSPAREQQSSRDTHFPVTLRWVSLALLSFSRSLQRPPSVFALSLWLILRSGDDPESALLQDSQPCFLHRPGRVSRRERNKQIYM